MNPFIIITIALALDFYLIWLVITEHDRRRQRLEKEEVRFGHERDKFFRSMIDGFGMSYYEATESYRDIKSFHELVDKNIELEKVIKDYKL